MGILTQYQPLELNEYIGNGQPWDLNTTHSAARRSCRPMSVTTRNPDWYKGTANAIYQNIDFIDRYNPDYVLMLSGDHIYKMDYAAMVAYHEKHKASTAPSPCADVPLAEASRFGIMNTNPGQHASTNSRKSPTKPKSTNASMGIYCFNWQVLRNVPDRGRGRPQLRQRFRQEHHSQPCWPTVTR